MRQPTPRPPRLTPLFSNASPQTFTHSEANANAMTRSHRFPPPPCALTAYAVVRLAARTPPHLAGEVQDVRVVVKMRDDDASRLVDVDLLDAFAHVAWVPDLELPLTLAREANRDELLLLAEERQLDALRALVRLVDFLCARRSGQTTRERNGSRRIQRQCRTGARFSADAAVGPTAVPPARADIDLAARFEANDMARLIERARACNDAGTCG